MIETKELFRSVYKEILRTTNRVKANIEENAKTVVGIENLFKNDQGNSLAKKKTLDLKAELIKALGPIHAVWMEKHPNPYFRPGQIPFKIHVMENEEHSGYYMLGYDTRDKSLKCKVSIGIEPNLLERALSPEGISVKSFSHLMARKVVHEEIHAAQGAAKARMLFEQGKKTKEYFIEAIKNNVLLADFQDMDDYSRKHLIYLAKPEEIEAYADNAAIHSLFVNFNNSDNPLNYCLEILDNEKKFARLAASVSELANYYGANLQYPRQFEPAWTSFMAQYVEKLKHYGENYGRAHVENRNLQRLRARRVAAAPMPVNLGPVLTESEF